MKRSVFGLLKTREDAEAVVGRLRNSGFSNTDISVLFPDVESTRDFTEEQATKAPEGAATGGTTGFVVGGVLGWLAGIGSLAIPGVGPFIAAGPIMAALSGAAVGAAVGGIAGALIGMGIPEFEAKRYESKLREGYVLISIHADDDTRAGQAREILIAAAAEDVAMSGEGAQPTRPAATAPGGTQSSQTAQTPTPQRPGGGTGAPGGVQPPRPDPRREIGQG